MVLPHTGVHLSCLFRHRISSYYRTRRLILGRLLVTTRNPNTVVVGNAASHISLFHYYIRWATNPLKRYAKTVLSVWQAVRTVRPKCGLPLTLASRNRTDPSQPTWPTGIIGLVCVPTRRPWKFYANRTSLKSYSNIQCVHRNIAAPYNICGSSA